MYGNVSQPGLLFVGGPRVINCFSRGPVGIGAEYGKGILNRKCCSGEMVDGI